MTHSQWLFSIQSFNTLVDTLKTRSELGYTLLGTKYQINLLQYADDSCIVGDSPASVQHLLHTTDRWLTWAGMRAKPSKCFSLAIVTSSSKLIHPHLTIAGEDVPFVGDKPFKFLGMEVQMSSDQQRTRQHLTSKLEEMMKRTDLSLVSQRQKLLIYKVVICPRLNWLLIIREFPLTWLQRKLEPVATAYLKKWSGLAKPANTAILYLQCSSGGLNLPSLTSLYKSLQVSRQCHLLTSSDPCTQCVAEQGLQKEESLVNCAFRPSVEVRDVMKEDPGSNHQQLLWRVKNTVKDADNQRRMDRLLAQGRQGSMLHSASSHAVEVWNTTVASLSSDQQKFILNSTVDILPHNVNLHLWKKKASLDCPLCGERQSLIHVLSCCPIALNL